MLVSNSFIYRALEQFKRLKRQLEWIKQIICQIDSQLSNGLSSYELPSYGLPSYGLPSYGLPSYGLPYRYEAYSNVSAYVDLCFKLLKCKVRIQASLSVVKLKF